MGGGRGGGGSGEGEGHRVRVRVWRVAAVDAELPTLYTIHAIYRHVSRIRIRRAISIIKHQAQSTAWHSTSNKP